jgi:hypothetical protein
MGQERDDDTAMIATIMDTEEFHPVAGSHSCCALLIALPALAGFLLFMYVCHVP